MSNMIKIGDKVKVLKDCNYSREVGEEGIVIDCDTSYNTTYKVEFETADRNGSFYNWFYEEELKLLNITQPSANNFIEIDDNTYLNKDRAIWLSIKPIILVTSAGNEEFFRIVFDYGVDNISSKKYNTKQEAINDLIKWGFINE